jgi:hypothetical protein
MNPAQLYRCTNGHAPMQLIEAIMRTLSVRLLAWSLWMPAGELVVVPMTPWRTIIR